jgi:glycosyltransferase involved in cell wall biosynthesis
VAFLSTDAVGLDGWGRYTAELVRALRPLGVEPVLVTSGPVEASLADEAHPGLLPPLFARRGSTPRALVKVGAVRRAIADCDVVHCMAEPYMPLAALAAARRPLVLTAHGTWAIRPLKRRGLGWLFRWAFARADLTIAISAYTLARVEALAKLRNTLVRSGGVGVEALRAQATWQPPAWTEGKLIALAVGAVKARKGFHVALEAIAHLRESLPSLHYVVLGTLDDAAYVSRLRARCAELDLEKHIHFIGRVDFAALAGWYRRADVLFQLPVNIGDSFEGFGLVYLEAGAYGTPSVATLGCGAAEAVRDSETGLLVPQNDPQAAANALLGLLSDDALRARLGDGARNWAETHTWADVAQAVMAEYERLLSFAGDGG